MCHNCPHQFVPDPELYAKIRVWLWNFLEDNPTTPHPCHNNTNRPCAGHQKEIKEGIWNLNGAFPTQKG